MIAGTLCRMQPADDRIESIRRSASEGIVVDGTQSYFDGGEVQFGTAAGTIERTVENVTILNDPVHIETESVERYEPVTAEWFGDPTGEGFLVASRTGRGKHPFPFNLLAGSVNRLPELVTVDVDAVLDELGSETKLWQYGEKEEYESDVNDVTIAYGERANDARSGGLYGPNIGAGFKAPWRSTVVRGIVYASGYIAIFDPSTADETFAGRFVAEVVLPNAEPREDEDEFTQEELT